MLSKKRFILSVNVIPHHLNSALDIFAQYLSSGIKLPKYPYLSCSSKSVHCSALHFWSLSSTLFSSFWWEYFSTSFLISSLSSL